MSQRLGIALSLFAAVALAACVLRADDEADSSAADLQNDAVAIAGEGESTVAAADEEEPAEEGAEQAAEEESDEADNEEVSADESAAEDVGEEAAEGEGDAGAEEAEAESDEDRQLRELQEADEAHQRRSEELAEAYQQAGSAEEKAQIETELSTVISEHFEIRQAYRAQELTRLEAQIEELRKEIEKRESMKDKLLQRRLVELIGESDDVQF